MNIACLVLRIGFAVFLLLFLNSNPSSAQTASGESLISPEHDRQLEKLIDPDGFIRREQAREKERLQQELWSGKHTQKIPRYLSHTENYDAYSTYMMYRAAVEGIEAAKKRIGNAADPGIKGYTWGAMQERLATNSNISEEKRAIEEFEKRRDFALSEWNKKDYGRTFGNLEKGISNKVVNPVTREEMDIIGINIAQRKRLDPEKQKLLDWVNKDTQAVLSMINLLPDGHRDKERLKHLVTHDQSMEAVTILEDLAEWKNVEIEKLKDGTFIFTPNMDHPYIHDLFELQENRKVDKIMEAYEEEKKKKGKEAEKGKAGVVSVKKTGRTDSYGTETAGIGEEPKNDAGTTVNAGAYEQGNRIVTKDGTEYEKKGNSWVMTGNNYGTYEPTDKIADLKNAENRTSGKDLNESGSSSGFDLAQNVNVTQSYKDGQRSKAKGKTKENLKKAGLTTSERVAAGEAEDQRKKGQIASQGMETGQSIGSAQQEGKKAQDTDRIMSETSIGTILAGGLMGGLSSGVATGLDSFFGTLGQGAGGQVSVSAGIQPPPPPKNESSGRTGSSTGSESSGEAGATTKTAGTNGNGISTGTGRTETSGGTGTAGGSEATTTKTKTNKNTTIKTNPTNTKTTKPDNAATSTQVTKPDCSQYRVSAESLTSQYERGAISTSAYQVQMRILRTKYKGCTDAVRPPTTSGTSKTSTKGSTKKKEVCEWVCVGYGNDACCAEWKCSCASNECSDDDPKLLKCK